MRLRHDSPHIAGWRRARIHKATKPATADDHWTETEDERAVPSAKEGDVWALADRTGYWLTCPRENCDQGVHLWHHGVDCPTHGVTTPEHPSCWTWTGSPEDGTLTANPSLQVLTTANGQPTHGCGFHGWLKNGVLAE